MSSERFGVSLFQAEHHPGQSQQGGYPEPEHPADQIGLELLKLELYSSLASKRADRFTKRIEYQRQNVPCYRVIDPDERQVEVWTPDDTFPRLERDRILWHPAGATQPFVLQLEFRPI